MKRNYYNLITQIQLVLIGSLIGVGKINAQTVTTFSYTGSIVNFTVPSCVTQMTMEARGAQGGSGGGYGARMIGTFTFAPGSVLKILVGNTGSVAPNQVGNGGGGGSFITLLNNTPLLIAGGGGGTGHNSAGGGYAQIGGVTTTSGQIGQYTGGNGGVNGNGGLEAYTPGNVCNAAGGGGLLTNGGSNGAAYGGTAFVNGGQGGQTTGGFGGGGGSNVFIYGCGSSPHGGGGGGGYSGGGGGGDNCNGAGGGGGSFNSGTNQSNTAAYQSGTGLVVLTYSTGGNSIFVTATPTIICAGATATLNASGMSTYTWGTGAQTSSITVTPTTTTQYSVTATTSNNISCGSIITVSVDAALPSLAIQNPTPGVCPGKTIAITASGATTYSWTGGLTNGTPFTPLTSTNYVVTGSNACGTSTAATSVTVYTTPTITATASTPSLCSGSSATVIGGGGNNYSWTGGVTNAQSFTPAATNGYTVTGASAQGCTATAAVTITVVQTPTNFPGATPPLICIGESATITVVGAQGYTWSAVGGNQSTFVVTPTITTVYTVTKSNGPCIDIKSVTVTVNGLPFAGGIASPATVCALQNSTLTGAGGLTYTWAPYGGIGNNLQVQPTVTTIFTVTASDGTCVNTATVLLTAKPIPTININLTSSTLCTGDCVNATLSGANTYTWLPGNLNVTTTPLCPTSNTSYTVLGTNTAQCTRSSSTSIVVHPVPNINVSTNKPLVCIGAASTLQVNGANTYTWSTGSFTTYAVVNPTVTEVYTVTGFYSNTGCNTTKTIQVAVFSPTFNAPSTASTCIGGTVNLCASGADSYTWNGGFQFPCIAVSPSVYTIYQVSASSTSLNVTCVSSRTCGLSIFANPTITAIAQRTTVCKGEQVNLVGQGGATYTWSTQQQGTTVQVAPNNQTTYTVLGATAEGCTGTSSVQVKVSQCTGMSEKGSTMEQLIIVYPNPNKGEFDIESTSEVTVTLINEIGQLIKTYKLSGSNSYRVRVTDLSSGIYFVTGEMDGKNIRQKIIVTK